MNKIVVRNSVHTLYDSTSLNKEQDTIMINSSVMLFCALLFKQLSNQIISFQSK